MNIRIIAKWMTAFSGTAALLVSGCGAGTVGGPDPARSTYFVATLVDGGPLPAKVKLPGALVEPELTAARLVPLDLGRTTDVRIFEDRGGNGTGSGNGRDSTVATGRMGDVRIFNSVNYDSVAVDVVRIGNVMFITRPHPDPSRSVVDTAYFENGVIVRKVHLWFTFNEPPTNQVITYTTVR